MISVKDVNANSLADNPVISQMQINNHEQIVFCNDNDSGLKAIIAVHNTVLGPSLGGLRMWPYKTEMEALNDVLRLSRGMTYKSSVAGLNLGGGKAVIIGDAKKDKTEALLRRFGKFVDGLSGRYITAEDVGVSSKDMEIISKETRYVTGLPESIGGSGDPSPVTAYGVYLSMKASAKERWGSDSLNGKKIAVQGVGHVGEYLVKFLSKEKAKIFIADINDEKLKSVSKEYGAEVISGDKMYDLDLDIYAPCALGATINTENLNKLKCSIICGAANNQLADEKIHGEMVLKKGILYAPDFVVNAGGIINVYSEWIKNTREQAMKQTESIYNTISNVFKISKAENVPTYIVANRLAEKRIMEMSKN